jgi:hypothetical protein
MKHAIWIIVVTALAAACSAPPVPVPTGIPATTPTASSDAYLFIRENSLWHGDPTGEARSIFAADTWVISFAAASTGNRIAAATIIFPAAGQPTRSNIYLLDGNAQPRLLYELPQGVIGGMAWAADGTLFVGVDGLRVSDTALGSARLQEIVRINTSDGTLMPFYEDALDPVISPDGTLLAYLEAADSATGERAPIAGLALSGIDGSAPRTIVDGSQFAGLYAPRFSPDGKQIIFAAAGGPSAQPPPSGLWQWLAPSIAEAHGDLFYDLWEVGIDGSGLHMVAKLDEDDPIGAFNADGSEIVVMAAGGQYRMLADGSALRKVSNVGGHGDIVWWQPRQ